MTNINFMEALAAGHYAFVDLGCGSGGSIDHCARRFKRGPGLGFEVDPQEAAEALRSGHDVIESDLLTTEVPARSVAFVAAMDFLEHLPDLNAAGLVLKQFCPAAREFFFIRHPSFEEMEYLAGLGLKLCWTDWSDHPNMMRIEELMELFKRLGLIEYAIFPRGLMIDASDDQIVPLSAPSNTKKYDLSLHGPKPNVRFDRPIFGQYDIFIRINNGIGDAEWERTIWTDVSEDAPSWASRIVSRTTTRPTLSRNGFGFYDARSSCWQVTCDEGIEVTIKYGAEARGWLPFAGVFERGRPGFGAYDPQTGDFFIRHTIAEGLADVTVRFGAPGGIPIAGDWTGAGVDTLGVYIPSTSQWFLRYENSSGPADESFSFGSPGAGWLPVVGDWDGDGRDSVGLYEPATASWHLRGGNLDGRSDVDFTFGPAGSFPLAGDWNNDGRDSIGVYAPDWGMWILRNKNSNGPADCRFVYRGEGAPVVLCLP
jgi:hypothetical protein